MSEIVVHRCELRIRRTAGWAWGASPDALINAATRTIPRLLGARLPAIAAARASDAPIHLRQPVTVRVATSVQQLVALADGASSSSEQRQLREQIEAEVEAAVLRAIASEPGASALAPPSRLADEAQPEAPAHEADELAAPDAPRRALRTWLRTGTLAAVLARLEPGAIALLHDLVLGESAAPIEVSAALGALVERAAARVAAADEWPASRIHARVAIAALVLAAEPAVTAPALRAAIDRVVPLDAPSPPARAERSERAEMSTPAAWYGELEIRSALPFLLLSSLRNAGWLDAMSALLAVHRREPDAFALAAGMAAKVLDPLDRGWARSPGDRLAIAVFAGRAEPIADAELVAAAARLQPVLAPLDAALRGVLARARRPVPLVLWHDERGWHLFDTDGMVAIAAGPALREVLAMAFSSPLLVPSRCADAATLESIDYANLRFITDAPPSRGESWRAFAGTTRRLYTNDTSAPAAELAAMTAHFDHWLELADELGGVLAERPAIAREPLRSFEASCSLAATAALADVGARLFPAEPTTPVLALTRFRDLDARVSVEPTCVRVRVPLGRRHAELMRHGMFGTFATVPWFGRRVIDLGGG